MNKSVALRNRGRGFKELEIRKDWVANALTSVQTDSLVLVSPKSTSTPPKFINHTSQNTKTMETLPKSTKQLFPTSTSSWGDFLAKVSALLEKEGDLTTPEELSSLKSLGFLPTKDHGLFYSKMSKAYLATTTERLSREYLKFSPTLGMSFNGKFLILKTSESPRIGKECSLSDILEEQVDQKYFLSQQMVDRLMSYRDTSLTPLQDDTGSRQPFIKVSEISPYQGDKVTQPNEVHPTLSAQGGNKLRGIGIQQDDLLIRRLTPTECERLQGFPDGWTENGLSSIMEICVNINPAIEKQLLTLGTVSSITSDGSGTVIPISQSECKEPVNIVLEELLPEDIAISTISHGNAMATLFNQSGTLLNATQLKESLISEKMVVKSTCKLWKVRLLGRYEKEKLSTILTWISETMQSITSISARTDENIIGVITVLNSQESNYSNGESLCLRMGDIVSISDTQRYKCLGNAVTVNVIRAIMSRI
jgi:site-specific DNA-cytosine methylase